MARVFTVLFSVLILSCTDSDNAVNKLSAVLADSILQTRWKAVAVVKDSIREGDLILRCGNDFASASLSDFSQHEKLYSHSGIALLSEGTMYVYSNMAGDINPDDIMRRDIVDSFISPVNNIALGVYRYNITKEELNTLKEIVIEYYANKLLFDMNFDLSTDDKMYCAEMIAKAVEKATNNRITIPKSEVNNELRQKYLKMAVQKKIVPSLKSGEHREYWGIDNLYLNPYCREVTKVVFDKPQTPAKFPEPENSRH